MHHVELRPDQLPIPIDPMECQDELDAKMRIRPSMDLVRRAWNGHPSRLGLLATEIWTHPALPTALLFRGAIYVLVAPAPLWRLSAPGAPTTTQEALSKPAVSLAAVLSKLQGYPATIELLAVASYQGESRVLTALISRDGTSRVTRDMPVPPEGTAGILGNQTPLVDICLEVLSGGT